MKLNLIKKALMMAFLSMLSVFHLSAQSHKVSGVVTGDDGLSIIGATVSVLGTDNGVITDVDGKYSITVPENATLLFSCLGYQSVQESVGKRSVIDVVLPSDSQMLDDLVFIGYGVQRRSDITGSVASIKAEDMKMHPATNVSEMLRGMSTGVQVTTSSGAPGSSASIQIRGARSLSASDSPLYVIDGVPATSTEFNLINSADVESIEILKDAAAQA